MMSADIPNCSLLEDSRQDRRNFLKHVGAGGILGLSSLLLGCQSTASSQKQILIGVTERPRMLDPRQATDALSSRINRLLYHQLIDFNEAFEPVPDLTEWQELSPRHYRFHLIKRPRFHHGKSLVAEDIAATYRSILDPSMGSPHRGSLKLIERVDVIDDLTVDFRLSEPDPLFIGRLVIGIMPADLLMKNHDFAKVPIGSGDAQFVSMTEQRLILKRLDTIGLHFIPVKDATVRVLKMFQGELDIVQNDLSPELVAYCQRQSTLKVEWHQGTNFGYIGFNFEDPLLQHLALRQAIAYGINRSEIIQAMFAGHARLAGGLLVPEHWCGVADIHGFDYRPEHARNLIAKLKLDGKIPPGLVNSEGLIELSYKTSSDPTRIRLATIYQSQLKAIGIQLKIQSYDWGTFYSDIKQGRFQLYSLAWVGIKSPDIFQYVFESHAVPPKGANRGRYRDPQADALIQAASQSPLLSVQRQKYQDLQRHLQETLAVLPLWYEDQFAVMRQNISNFKTYADGRWDGLIKIVKS